METILEMFEFEGQRFEDGYDESFVHSCNKTGCKFYNDICMALEPKIELRDGNLICFSFEACGCTHEETIVLPTAEKKEKGGYLK